VAAAAAAAAAAASMQLTSWRLGGGSWRRGR